MLKKLFTPINTLLMLLGMFITVGVTAPTAYAAERGCNDNSIIRCGSHSVNELRSDYAKNEKGDLDNIYSHYGISASMINGSGIKTGTLTRDGRVIVNGKTVATGAETVGRHYLSGSKTVKIGNGTYYQRSTSISLNQDSTVFVWLDANGEFISAIIQYCGNPVKAKPVPQPKPAAACVGITPNKMSRTQYTFTAVASRVNGATISGYVLTVTAADGTKQSFTVNTSATRATSPAVTLKDGRNVAVVAVKTSLGVKEAPACKVTLTVTPLPPKQVEVCNPETGKPMTVDEKDAGTYPPVGDIACTPARVCDENTKQIITVPRKDVDKYLPEDSEKCKVQGTTVEELPSTGPAEMIGGGLGISSVSAAAYYWRASRRQLIAKLLNK